MGLRNRIIATYGCWAVAALGTTMTWATRFDGAKFSGQTGGLNGRMVLVHALGAAGLIVWWDRGGRVDTSRVQMALFIGILAVAVILRNVYNILDDPGFNLGLGVWVSLVGAIPGLIIILSLRKA